MYKKIGLQTSHIFQNPKRKYFDMLKIKKLNIFLYIEKMNYKNKVKR